MKTYSMIILIMIIGLIEIVYAYDIDVSRSHKYLNTDHKVHIYDLAIKNNSNDVISGLNLLVHIQSGFQIIGASGSGTYIGKNGSGTHIISMKPLSKSYYPSTVQIITNGSGIVPLVVDIIQTSCMSSLTSSYQVYCPITHPEYQAVWKILTISGSRSSLSNIDPILYGPHYLYTNQTPWIWNNSGSYQGTILYGCMNPANRTRLIQYQKTINMDPYTCHTNPIGSVHLLGNQNDASIALSSIISIASGYYILAQDLIQVIQTGVNNTGQYVGWYMTGIQNGYGMYGFRLSGGTIYSGSILTGVYTGGYQVQTMGDTKLSQTITELEGIRKKIELKYRLLNKKQMNKSQVIHIPKTSKNNATNIIFNAPIQSLSIILGK